MPSQPNPNAKRRSWCITIRPSNGVTDEFLERLVKVLNKPHSNLQYSTCFEEMKDAARHIHAQLWYRTPVDRDSVNKTFITRLLGPIIANEHDYNSQMYTARQGTQIAYNYWTKVYCEENSLKKDDPSIMLVDNPPPNPHDPEWYPTPEEQALVRKKAHAVDKQYNEYEDWFDQWYEPDSHGDITLKLVSIFLSDMMYSSRKMRVISDGRKCKQVCKSLYNYITKDLTGSYFYSKPDNKLARELKGGGFDDDEINKIICS